MFFCFLFLKSNYQPSVKVCVCARARFSLSRLFKIVRLGTACNGADELLSSQTAFHTICTDIDVAFIMHIHTNILCQ